MDRRGRIPRIHSDPVEPPPERPPLPERLGALMRGGIPRDDQERRWQESFWAHRAERWKADDRRG